LKKVAAMKLHIRRFQDPEELFPMYIAFFRLELTSEERKLIGGHVLGSRPLLTNLIAGIRFNETSIQSVIEREQQIRETVASIARQLADLEQYVASEDVVTFGEIVDGRFVVS
jgi:hypothetical protein